MSNERKVINNFEKYVRRQDLARFMARYELFKLIKSTKGSIIECGVHQGGGLMGWAKLSSNLEPYAIHRKVIGFDTFEGFVEINEKDESSFKNKELKKGGFSTETDVYTELMSLIAEYDENRYLNQFSKIELIKGDAIQTIPEYLKNNQHLIIALLFLDFDLYEPTKTALEYFVSRVPKGGIIAFDEINENINPPAVLGRIG
ncbi:class I SAM-dependent methyltransferase [Acetobacterium wieringae]|uniref:Class I SAM-dependent methyltransferase n=1 Tax=Acetobacterium wieringae TaxID=52694 RepID=A0A5D0WP36_9FIRM|nr:TylF/MycF/NovP-related O-methyltransferase [Acetobacterium wieringae]TYC85949.1 class I SAM-dependent methyltransferase [Acetobacterium wieringae]